MANYQLLKADIDAKVYQNGKQEITGENLNSVLNAMVTTLGAEYQFAGVATTATNPGTPDAKVFYIANGKGTYTNFGGIEVTEDEVVVLYWDTAWHKEATGIASQEKLTKLDQKVDAFPGGINLFNWKTCEINKFINPNNGNIVTNNNCFVSDYIYVKGLSVVKYTALDGTHNYILYNQQKEKLSWGNSAEITIGDATYLMISGMIYQYDKDMVYIGEKPSVYVPYTNVDANSLYPINNEHAIEQIDMPVISKLVRVPTTFEPGIFGSSHSGYQTSDYIEIIPGISQHYFTFKETGGDVYKLKFYDKDKNEILRYSWRALNNYVGKIFKLVYPFGCQYVRYSMLISSGNEDGIFTCPVSNIEDIINEVLDINSIAHNSCYAETNNILWVGTSIPEGATYPIHSCEANGYHCINNSKGQQSLGLRAGNTRCLTWTVDEFKAAFTYTGEAGKIGVTETEFKTALDKTYERAVLPFIRGEQLVITDGSTAAPNGIINPDAIKVSAIVIDHGYNDNVSINELMENPESIDWSSRDRTNFVGAYNYLVDKIQEINHFIKIVVGGYFENDWVNNGDKLCGMHKLVSEHFHLELFDVWNYSQICNLYMAGTQNYIENFNQTYGKSYSYPASRKNSQGNFMAHSLYCPDDIHPHSDLTGNSNKHLDAIYTRFMKGLI